MLQVFLVLLTAVTFILMAVDPQPADLTEAQSAWTEQSKASDHLKPDASFTKQSTMNKNDSEQI
ncbi:ABZJ_00068 family colistin stress protein [Acinetobacter haemolyticus]|uniref:ABZJ_00068 family colistin stress protein n=1 Tax=Acinetobacter haemolyticus TaxID=29430 RepID=UPI0002F8621B|nr:hypothetical protein [Acinetobacter haemolyticus]NAR53182.1 hypothetical protein [Acinetobacter haemolyticus]NAS07476.1 hypothetical protein [Acinetobacter haemolyticus]